MTNMSSECSEHQITIIIKKEDGLKTTESDMVIAQSLQENQNDIDGLTKGYIPANEFNTKR